MGHAMEERLGNQVVMANRNATFLKIYYDNYKQYNPSSWVENSLQVPYRLSKKYPNLIHVEGYNFTRPNWNQLPMIFEQNYDWSTNYAMHMYIRAYKKEANIDIIRRLNTTVGSVCRHVLFGNKELCK